MRNFLGVRMTHKKYGALTLSVLLGLSVCSSAFAAEQTKTVFKDQINGTVYYSSEYKRANVWDSASKTYKFTKDSTINAKSITGASPINISAPGVTLTLNSKDQYGIQSYCERGFKADHNYKKTNDITITAKKVVINVDQIAKSGSGKETFGIVCGSDNTKYNVPHSTVTVNGDVDITVKNKYYKAPNGSGEQDPTFTNGIATVHHGNIVVNGNAKVHVRVPEQEQDSPNRPPKFLSHYYVNGIFAGLNYDEDKPGSTVTIGGDVDVDVDGTGVHAGARSLITIRGGGTIRTKKDTPPAPLRTERGGGYHPHERRPRQCGQCDGCRHPHDQGLREHRAHRPRGEREHPRECTDHHQPRTDDGGFRVSRHRARRLQGAWQERAGKTRHP